MNTVDTMVVVADGSRARFFTTDAEMVELTELPSIANKQHAAHRHKGQGTADSGHHDEESRFAKEVAAHLAAEGGKKAFRDLVLVAPPHMLGDLRGALPKQVALQVTATVPKDLVGDERHTLAKHLRTLLTSKPLPP
jgi:protein required for attachment to host cells